MSRLTPAVHEHLTVTGHGCARVYDVVHVTVAREFRREPSLEGPGDFPLHALGVHLLQYLSYSFHDGLPFHAHSVLRRRDFPESF